MSTVLFWQQGVELVSFSLYLKDTSIYGLYVYGLYISDNACSIVGSDGIFVTEFSHKSVWENYGFHPRIDSIESTSVIRITSRLKSNIVMIL